MGVAVRVTEVTLKKACNTFTNEHPGVKIGRCSFESLPPKNIRLRPYAQRLQCCCTCHTNMDYIGKAINSLFTKNNKPSPFPNDVLISSALCEQNSIKCILQCCEKCVDFSKIDDLAITSLKCSKSCFKENKDCTDHTIKLNQFQRVSYMHKGKEKKKLKLVDNMLTTSQLVELLKNQLKKFALHQFNVQQTTKTYDNILTNLDQYSTLKIHDFSENYTCLLPEEVQSIYWTQETVISSSRDEED